MKLATRIWLGATGVLAVLGAVYWSRKPRSVSSAEDVLAVKPGERVLLTGKLVDHAAFTKPNPSAYALGFDSIPPNSGGIALWIVGSVPKCILGCTITVDAVRMSLPGGGPEGQPLTYFKEVQFLG